jgi:hypothetical protein
VSSPISIWQEKQAVEIACMPENKGSQQGSTMYIGMCEGDNHVIMLKCMSVSMIVCMYVLVR